MHWGPGEGGGNNISVGLDDNRDVFFGWFSRGCSVGVEGALGQRRPIFTAIPKL